MPLARLLTDDSKKELAELRVKQWQEVKQAHLDKLPEVVPQIEQHLLAAKKHLEKVSAEAEDVAA